MLYKSSRPGYRKWIKKTAVFLIAAETIAFAVSYLGWHRLNTSRDFRHYVRDNYPLILESYYQVGEYIGGDEKIRRHDELIWKQEQAAAGNPASSGIRAASSK
ncbi:uncharacterized protein LOC129726460 [Wyeomyia smithii]|uniref:uncharacterized protein LOC129726460 n=1 Tax=Wyeomyia smithii TaxID=174621 RepID=UPI002467BE5A|nr:uncharacterized protein LOC129726460 [Wyeomyia smithii]